MDHWRARPPLPMLEVPYEALVSEPEDWIHRLIDFCSLDWSEACLRPETLQRKVQTASYAQVREPIHQRSVGRYAHYDAHLAPLKRVLTQEGRMS